MVGLSSSVMLIMLPLEDHFSRALFAEEKGCRGSTVLCHASKCHWAFVFALFLPANNPAFPSGQQS
jgi:hypothetical protein